MALVGNTVKMSGGGAARTGVDVGNELDRAGGGAMWTFSGNRFVNVFV